MPSGPVCMAPVGLLVVSQEVEHERQGLVRALLHCRGRGETRGRELRGGEVLAGGVVVAPAPARMLVALEVVHHVGDGLAHRVAGPHVVRAAGGLEEGQGHQRASGLVGVWYSVGRDALVAVDHPRDCTLDPRLVLILHAHVADVRRVPVCVHPFFEEAEDRETCCVLAHVAVRALLHAEPVQDIPDGSVHVLAEGRHEGRRVKAGQQDEEPEEWLNECARCRALEHLESSPVERLATGAALACTDLLSLESISASGFGQSPGVSPPLTPPSPPLTLPTYA